MMVDSESQDSALTFFPRGSAGVGFRGGRFQVAHRWSWWVFVQDLLWTQISENDAWQGHLMAHTVAYR